MWGGVSKHRNHSIAVIDHSFQQHNKAITITLHDELQNSQALQINSQVTTTPT
jgi:hypothetical protein